MVKVKELKFRPHPAGVGGLRATAEFGNGYKASVVTGSLFYTTPERPYEIAVLHEDKIVYDTPVTADVCGYLTEEEADEVLRQIEELPERKKRE